VIFAQLPSICCSSLNCSSAQCPAKVEIHAILQIAFHIEFSCSELLLLIPADSTCLSCLVHSDLYDGSVAHSLAHAFTHSLIPSPTHSRSFIHVHTQLLTNALAPLLTHSSCLSLTRSPTLSLAHPLTRSVAHSHTHSPLLNHVHSHSHTHSPLLNHMHSHSHTHSPTVIHMHTDTLLGCTGQLLDRRGAMRQEPTSVPLRPSTGVNRRLLPKPS